MDNHQTQPHQIFERKVLKKYRASRHNFYQFTVIGTDKELKTRPNSSLDNFSERRGGIAFPRARPLITFYLFELSYRQQIAGNNFMKIYICWKICKLRSESSTPTISPQWLAVKADSVCKDYSDWAALALNT
jgi:hypothetical protein